MRVNLSSEARSALDGLEVYFAGRGDYLSARRFVDDLLRATEELSSFPHRNPLREDIAPGVRVFIFRGRVSVLYRVAEDEIRVVGFFSAGQRLAF